MKGERAFCNAVIGGVEVRKWVDTVEKGKMN